VGDADRFLIPETYRLRTISLAAGRSGKSGSLPGFFLRDPRNRRSGCMGCSKSA
jgi:hypothetical protein